MSDPSVSRVVIIGSGYAGVRVARDLARARRRGAPVDVVLLNNTSTHLDRSLLYEVAAAYLPRESVASTEVVTAGAAVELDHIFEGLPVKVRVLPVTRINVAQRLLTVGQREAISYDYLVITLGARLNTAGVPGAAEHAFSVTNLNDALTLRHHVVKQFHRAAKLPPAEQTAALTFVVVGAGAAGVEISAEMAGQVRQQCRKHGLSLKVPRLLLLEAGTSILRRLPPDASEYANQRLRKLGVDIRLSQSVVRITTEQLELASGITIPTRTVVWAGGLKAHPVLVEAGFPLQGWGVKVQPTLQVVGQPHVFVAGDAAIVDTIAPPLPASVPVAYTQGALVAQNILHLIREQPLRQYHYRTIGELIALGGKDALVVLGGKRTWHGRPGWVLKKLLTLRYWLGLLSWRGAWQFWRHSLQLQALND